MRFVRKHSMAPTQRVVLTDLCLSSFFATRSEGEVRSSVHFLPILFAEVKTFH